MASADRPDVPEQMLARLDALLTALPRVHAEDAWIGRRWRVGGATVAHVFGGEDGLLRITFRAEPEEVFAMEHMGPPYFRADWGANVVGLIVDEGTDWEELGELLTDSYRLQAPARLAEQVPAPGIRS
ncbi:MmcQ/YjbR family DNA-binding protein [Occultella glacieicola]|nr:MmcQ/YjbR family DNA-binding protein [Occultella glacieicola]